MKKPAQNPIVIYSKNSAQFLSATTKLLDKEKITFLKLSLESSTESPEFLEIFDVKPTPKPSKMSRREKLLHFSESPQPSVLIFFCTHFLGFSSIENLNSKQFVTDLNSVGNVLDTLTGHLPSLMNSGGKIIFVGTNTDKYGAPQMASFRATQQALTSIISSLRENLDDYVDPSKPQIQIVHIETTRPDSQFIEIFEDQFDPGYRKKTEENLYDCEANKLWSLVEKQYSKMKIESTSKKLAKTIVKIVGSKKSKKYYLID